MDNNQFPEEGDLVLCKVKEIHKTTVFVSLDAYGRTGVIATSEIAPGRIRNIRDYVVVNKKIICKVLRIDRNTGHIDLSLRRVTQKETREEMQKYKNEEIALKLLGIVVGKDAEKIAQEIKKDYPLLHQFFESSIPKPEILESYLTKEDAKKLLAIISDKIKAKKISAKATISVSSTEPNGIVLIKNALLKQKDVKINYIGAPNYTITAEDENHKVAHKKLETAIASIIDSLKHHGKVEVVKND